MKMNSVNAYTSSVHCFNPESPTMACVIIRSWFWHVKPRFFFPPCIVLQVRDIPIFSVSLVFHFPSFTACDFLWMHCALTIHSLTLLCPRLVENVERKTKGQRWHPAQNFCRSPLIQCNLLFPPLRGVLGSCVYNFLCN